MLMKLRDVLKRKGNQKGFTLVELIIVMAILAVLGGLAVPKFKDVLTNSKKSADAANVKVLQSAVELYYNQTGGYPADLNALVTNGNIDQVPTQVYPTEGVDFSYSNATGVVSDPNPGS